MIPCLYHVGETEYRTNGIGKLADCTSCTVTEERNSSYELALTYPMDGIHAESLVEGNIILAKSADNKNSQPFRIYKVTTSMDGTLEVAARHISYQLNDITVSPTTVVTGTYDQVNAAFAALKENASTDCPFDFETDISSDAYFGILEPVSFRSALGGVDGSMLDTFGGEFEWDFYTVRLWKSRGADNGVRIVYGKNLVDFKQEKDAGNVITGVHPYWKDGETGEITELPEKVVLLEDSDSPYERIGLLDCSSEYEEEPTWDQLRSYAGSYLTSTTTTEPNIDIDIDFAQLWQTPGYEDIVEAERVSLCDTVHVFITKLGIEVSTVVTQTVYDVLLEKYQSITLSNSPTSTRNSSLNLTLATTSQVKTLIAMTDTSIRLSVSSRYATKATLENNYSTTVEIQSLIALSEEGITLAFDKKLSDEYSTTEEIQSLIELSESGILLEFDKYSTTEEVQSMIELSEEGIALTYTKNGEVRSQFAMEDDSITISSGVITFDTGSLVIKSNTLNLSANGDLTIDTSQFTLDSSGNASFSGTLSAPNGNIGGWTIGTGSLYNGTDSMDSNISGVYLGTSGIRNYSGGNYLNITSGSVENGDADGDCALLNSGCLELSYQWTKLGEYRTSGWAYDGTKRGLSIDLEYAADYIAFARRLSSSANTYSTAYVINWNIGSDNIDGYSERHVFYNTVRMIGAVGLSSTLTTDSYIYGGNTIYAGTTSDTSARQVYARNSYGSIGIGVNSGSTASRGLIDGVANSLFAYWDGSNSRYVFGNNYPTRITGSDITLASAVSASSSLTVSGRIYLGDEVSLYHGTYNSAACVWDYNSFYAAGDIACGGTKYRVVDTEHYGKIGMNAYETASAMFGDSGSGTIGGDGQITIFFPPEFLEVIDMAADYQVFVTQVSAGTVSYIEKQNGSFTVFGEPETEFDWMVSAHQRDYTMNRMESVDLDVPENIEFDESIFDQDLVAEEAVNAMIENYEREVNLV